VWAPPITNMTVPATASASASTIAESSVVIGLLLTG
jgi:hypothetical protein